MKIASTIASIACVCWAATAAAGNSNPHGTGQVLLYPYYTGNENQDTYFSVGNFGRFPQVVKVRFLEGRAGRPPLDNDVVLMPRHDWTATLTVDDAGGSNMM